MNIFEDILYLENQTNNLPINKHLKLLKGAQLTFPNKIVSKKCKINS